MGWLRGRHALLLRFGVVSLALFALLGVALVSLLAHAVQERAVRDAELLARTLSDTAIQPHLRAEDLDGDPLTPARRDELGQLMRTILDETGILHATLFSANQEITWADREELIGGPNHESAQLREALLARTASTMTRVDGQLILETYVPVRLAGESRVSGSFELYLPLDRLQQEARRDARAVVALLVGALLLVWLSLLPVYVRTSRALRRSLRASEVQARTDVLTGLPNRLAFEEALAAPPAASGSRAVLLLDVDHFKDINDTFGHKAGDQLLQVIACQLRAASRPEDLVARLGGDEFAVVLTDVEPLAAAGAVRAAVGELSLDLAGARVGTSTSLGLAIAPTPSIDPGVLFQQADIAMYAAKRTGAGLVVFEPGLAQDHSERLELLAELRDGIRAGQLRLYAQPAVQLRDGRITGAEVLVRWEHPRLGLVAPARFVPLAEETDLVHELSAWVLDRAVAACAGWVAAGADLCVAVNLSPRDLTPELPGEVEAALRRHGLDPTRLSLELTETCLPQSMELAARVLGEVHALGVNLSVDDFGTGYATFSWLRELHFNALKIDRSFVGDLGAVPGAEELVRHVIALAHGLGKVAVAEGVESSAQLAVLERLGCDFAQGYALGEPMPIEAFLTWLGAEVPALVTVPAARAAI